MTEHSVFDVAIIGGGIVGTATAMALSKNPKIRVVVLEAEDRLAAHQTGNNSGVIHSGLYYKPGSLKATNCAKGREEMYAFCQKHEIPHEQCGKIVVATCEQEIKSLDELERRGKANGLSGIKRIDAQEIKQLEPAIKGIAGLHVPQTGIVDYEVVTNKYAQIVKDQGGEIILNARVIKVQKENGTLLLKTKDKTIKAKNLVNCAGLQSDRVTRLCGIDPKLKIVPFRGEYYEIVPQREHLVNNLVYPVPDPRFPFLGVHFTRMVKGGVEAGPNAVLALKREGYGRFSFSLKDVMSFVFYFGFWKMALKFWWTGIGEIRRSLSKRAFVRALRRLMPELKMSDVHRAGAGVRAQALEPSGALSDDFKIIKTPNMVHVLNAPSPAATASISIGQSIADTSIESFGL